MLYWIRSWYYKPKYIISLSQKNVLCFEEHKVGNSYTYISSYIEVEQSVLLRVPSLIQPGSFKRYVKKLSLRMNVMIEILVAKVVFLP